MCKFKTRKSSTRSVRSSLTCIAEFSNLVSSARKMTQLSGSPALEAEWIPVTRVLASGAVQQMDAVSAGGQLQKTGPRVVACSEFSQSKVGLLSSSSDSISFWWKIIPSGVTFGLLWERCPWNSVWKYYINVWTNKNYILIIRIIIIIVGVIIIIYTIVII